MYEDFLFLFAFEIDQDLSCFFFSIKLLHYQIRLSKSICSEILLDSCIVFPFAGGVGALNPSTIGGSSRPVSMFQDSRTTQTKLVFKKIKKR